MQPQVGFMMLKALDELFNLKSTKLLPIIFNVNISNISKTVGDTSKVTIID